jgi:surface protein
MDSVFDKDNGLYHATTKARIPFFNENIGSWQTGAVVSMYLMFNGASAFNQDISSWDTHEVVNMAGMFQFATTFNNGIATNTGGRPLTRNDETGVWNTEKVTNMSFMFSQASAFNQDVSSWDTSAVTDMSYMFNGATVYNGLGIYKWTLKPVTKPDINEMFRYSGVPDNTNDGLIWSMWKKKYSYTNSELTNAGLTSTAQETTLSYPPGINTLFIDQPIEPILATVTTVRGKTYYYRVLSTEPLPYGLSIDSLTGEIRGKPESKLIPTQYTIILKDENNVEWARATIILEVKAVIASGQMICNRGVATVTIIVPEIVPAK